MNEIYVDRDFYSRGKIIEMAKDKYVELHGIRGEKDMRNLKKAGVLQISKNK